MVYFIYFLFFEIINKVVLYLAVHQGCEHSHTSKRGLYVQYIMGLSTPILSKRKPYMLYVIGVESPTPCQQAELFSYMLYIAIFRLLGGGGKAGCGHTHNIQGGMFAM